MLSSGHTKSASGGGGNALAKLELLARIDSALKINVDEFKLDSEIEARRSALLDTLHQHCGV
jgi:hypothetical protein